MIEIPIALKTTLTLGTIGISGMLSAAIGDQTPITLGGACGVGMVVFGGALYVGRWQKGVEDRLKNIERAVGTLPCDVCHLSIGQRNQKKRGE